MKVYGPYRHRPKGGKERLFVNIVDNGVRKSRSYARYLMEQHLGHPVPDDMDVDHIDEDPMNNSLENLRLLPRKENRGRSNPEKQYVKFICPACGSEATRDARQVRRTKKRGCAGPFCDKKCSRKWQVQNLPPTR